MTELSRRQFLARAGLAAGSSSLASLLALGLDPNTLHAATVPLGWKLERTRMVPSVCPYCAVGCGQLVHVNVRDKRIVNIEGNPESPINQGTLCPKGAATYQLVVNPNRVTQVWYRAPGAAEWDKTKTLDWAMDRIAQLVKQTRDDTFQETWTTRDAQGQETRKRVNHTLAISSLGGATMDNEWNYVQAKLMRALGVVYIENQARI